MNFTDSDWWFHASQSHSEPPPSNGLRTVRSPPRAKVLSSYEQAEDWLREVRYYSCGCISTCIAFLRVLVSVNVFFYLYSVAS